MLYRIVIFLFVLILSTGAQIESVAKTPTQKQKENKPLSYSASFRQITDGDLCYLLNRIAFGPRPGDLQALRAIGINNYIEQQLQPDTITESPIITAYISSNWELTANPGQLFATCGPPAIKAAEEASKNPDDKKRAQDSVRKRESLVIKKFAQLRLMRAQYSPKQLQEVMTDFWFNHFNIYGEKGLDHLWVGVYEDKAIRSNALGKFRDLLGATCHHAAMQFYLDNWQNSTPPANSDKTQNKNQSGGRFSGLNENYARELMELHTLGVDGGYSQQDVIQLAKILTGLGLPPQDKKALAEAKNINPITGDYFDAKRHDFSDKMLMGYPIRGSGENEIEQALDFLASRPATAHHISYQLAQYFVADKPPASLVDKLTIRFKQTNGDIKAVLKDLFTSNEFWDPRYRYAKYKNPFRYTVSVLRATNAKPTNYDPVMTFLKQQGMPIYGCITPDGYKNTKEAWLSSNTLLKRITFSTDFAAGRMKNICPLPPDYTVVGTVFGASLSPNTVEVITSAPAQIKLALLLGSPEFMQY